MSEYIEVNPNDASNRKMPSGSVEKLINNVIAVKSDVDALVNNIEVQQVISKSGLITNRTTDSGVSLSTEGVSWYAVATPAFISPASDIMGLLGCINTVDIPSGTSITGNTRNDVFYEENLGQIGGSYLLYNYLVYSGNGVDFGDHEYMFVKADGELAVVGEPEINYIKITDNVRLYIISRQLNEYTGSDISVMVGNSVGVVTADISIGNFKAAYSSTPFLSKIIAEKPATSSSLQGKKMVVIGDSMLNDGSVGTAKMFPNLIALRNGMDIVNYGVSGSRLAVDNETFGPSILNRYSDMDDDADYVIVFGGTNDASELVPLGVGTVDSFSGGQETFNGALNDLCDGLITKYPTSKIMFITPYPRNPNYKDYADAIKERCAYYNIPVFDNFTDGGVCWTNTTQVTALTKNDTYHLNAAGHKYVSSKYESFIKSL